MTALPRAGRLAPLAHASAAVLVATLLTAGLLAARGWHPSATRALAGAYSLRSLAGRAVPAVVFDSTVFAPDAGRAAHIRVLVTGGELTLAASGWYTERLTYAVYIDGERQTVPQGADTGSYARDGSTVRFRSATGRGTSTGALGDGGTVLLAQDLFGSGARTPALFGR